MPAFRLTQLNAQIEELIWKFTRPVEFKASLNILFEKYADWAYRPGLAVRQGILIPTYHVQPLILQKIEQTLYGLSQENPLAGLTLADELWKDEYLEVRLIAVSLLGASPLDDPDRVMKRLNDWSNPSESFQLLDELFNKGTQRLRREKPELWLTSIDNWVSHTDVRYQEMSLRAMLAMVNDRSFENLPPIFRMLGDLIKQSTERLQVPILDLIEALVDRSALETLYFLRQLAISEGENREVLNHVRRSLRFFDEDMRRRLRGAIFDQDYFEEE